MTIIQKAESAETKNPDVDQETSKEENLASYDLVDEELQHIELEHDNLVDEELEMVEENHEFLSKPDQDKIVHNELVEALELAIFERLEIDNDVLDETKDDEEDPCDVLDETKDDEEDPCDEQLVYEGEKAATTSDEDLFYPKDELEMHTQESQEEVEQEHLDEINSNVVVSKSETFDILDE